MQDIKKSKAAWSAGMAAVFLSALALAQPAAFAADDHMMMDGGHSVADKMMMDHGAKLRGNIASVQLGDNGAPQWIQSGIWVLSHNGDSVSFIARINMVGADGTAPHTHSITHFAAERMSTEGNTHTVYGTATVSTKDGNVPNVAVKISIINNAAITIQIDPASLGGHFGKNPVYGTASAASRGAMMEHAMMMDDHRLTKTSVPVTLPLTKGYVAGNEVFYISTEASDRDLAKHLTDVMGSRVVYAPALAKTPAGSLANIYAFANGIKGTGPLGFQASIASTNVGDSGYSPLWRILATKWSDPAQAKFLTTASQIADAADAGRLSTEVAGVIVNCPFVVA